MGLVYSFSEPSSDQMEEEKRCHCLLRLRACRRGAMAFRRSEFRGCLRRSTVQRAHDEEEEMRIVPT